MKNTLRNIFHSPKFVIGFIIFFGLLAFTLIYPFFVAADPLDMVGQGNFFKPGTYVSVQDTVDAKYYTLNIQAKSSNLGDHIEEKDKQDMRDWLLNYGEVSQEELDAADDNALVVLWLEHYDEKAKQKGLLASKKKAYVRLNKEIVKLASDADLIIAVENEDGELEESKSVDSKQYVNTKDIANQRKLVLGTDN